MKISKTKSFFARGRKITFTLALFILVFAVASIVKIQASSTDSATGWLGGWSQDAVGNYTGLGWVSLNNTNQGGAIPYGVNIPPSDGNVTGYAWANGGGTSDNGLQNGIGWIDFDPQDHCGSAYNAASCNAPDNSGADATKGGVKRIGNNLVGWARIVEIAKASASGNSGGWTGWIKMSGTTQDGSSYGVDVTKLDGTGANKMYAWSGSEIPGVAGELGWINFSWGKYTAPCTPVCGTAVGTTYCSTTSAPKDGDSNLCVSGCGTASPVIGSGPWSWSCTAGSNSVSCSAGPITPAQNGSCGSADGSSIFCSKTPTDDELCSSQPGGITTPSGGSNYGNWNWTCKGQCGGSNASCSAKGTKACGWIETNP